MVAEVQHFEFGLPSRVQAPDAEPNPEDYIEYTAWHISRALEFHAFKSNKTVEPVLHSFRPTNVLQKLEVVRAIQPFQRMEKGKLVTFGPRDVTRANQAKAILLYALLPGVETERCSACESQSGNGPFSLCISGGDRWTSGACLCCEHTGTAARCDLSIKHANYLYRKMREMGKLSVTFPAGAEKECRADQLEVWRAMIVQEQTRRTVKVALAMQGKVV